MAGSEGQAAEGASIEDIAEQLRRIKVGDIVIQTVTGLISLGSLRLSGDQRDLAQARLAIDTLRALEPVIREQVSAELAGELQTAITSLQLGYAEATSAKPEPEASTSTAAEPESGEQAPADASSGE
ncbi:MAG: DUF1844 domain-containing protein [Gaiellaceae bacterium]